MCTSLYVNCVSMEFSRQEYWSRLPFPSTGDFPDPGIEPGSPTLQVDSLPSELPGKPVCKLHNSVKRKMKDIHYDHTRRTILAHEQAFPVPLSPGHTSLRQSCIWVASLMPSSFQVAQMVKNLPTMWEARVRFLGQEDPLEEEMATQSSILARGMPWTEEPGGPQLMGSQRVGHDWVNLHFNLPMPSAALPTYAPSLLNPHIPQTTHLLPCLSPPLAQKTLKAKINLKGQFKIQWPYLHLYGTNCLLITFPGCGHWIPGFIKESWDVSPSEADVMNY